MQRVSPKIYEEHCTVLADWWERRLRGQTLLYFDAHLDLQFINEKRLEKLRLAQGPEQFRSFEKPSHLLPDSDYVYGLENFLYPASQLGIIEHLIWVAPPHVDIGQSEQVYHHLQQMDGVTFADISRICRTAEGCYEAKLLGLRITLCRLQDLARLELPKDLLLDIDTDFFVSLPEDRAWLDPAALFNEVAQAGLNPTLVTIARSVSSGFMPLRYRYFADYLEALWEHDDEKIAHYAYLFQITERLEKSSDSALLAELAVRVNEMPTCAATRYLYDSQRGGASQTSSAAAALDEAYRFDPVRMASEQTNRHLTISHSTLDCLYKDFQDLHAGHPPEGHIAFGLSYATNGNVAKALHCYWAYGQPHPALALEIGQLLQNESDTELLEELLRIACKEDPSCSIGHLLTASLKMRRKAWTLALDHLEISHRRAPAWLEPLYGLVKTHDALGNLEKARFFADMIRQAHAQGGARSAMSPL